MMPAISASIDEPFSRTQQQGLTGGRRLSCWPRDTERCRGGLSHSLTSPATSDQTQQGKAGRQVRTSDVKSACGLFYRLFCGIASFPGEGDYPAGEILSRPTLEPLILLRFHLASHFTIRQGVYPRGSDSHLWPLAAL